MNISLMVTGKGTPSRMHSLLFWKDMAIEKEWKKLRASKIVS